MMTFVLLAVLAQQDFDCGFHLAYEHQREWHAKVRAGEITRPAPPEVRPRSAPLGMPGIVDEFDFHFYEDSAGLLLTNFSFEDLTDLMTDAANDLLVTCGDEFDFIGFWLNFVPDHLVGAAFYLQMENDVTGIGEVGVLAGEPTVFNLRPDYGLAGDNVEGFIMMWNVNDSFWQTGTGPGADFTRLAAAHEIEHRFGVFLSPLLDGREMQGISCGNEFHWNNKVDGQASCMELLEWTGTSPATIASGYVEFNFDIPGGTYSYTDLYLMGYISPAAMDAGNSELRYMNDTDCFSDYFGTITDFTSADIIAADGPRVPSHLDEDKDYRTAWIFFHLPGDEPDLAELTKAAEILNQQTIDFAASTLGIGTMDHTLPLKPPIAQVGNAVPGLNGVPVLTASGTLLPDDAIDVRLSNALENATAYLLVGFDVLITPFKGGVIVPDINPPGFYLVLGTDDLGEINLSSTWPSGVPSGFSTILHYWIPDPAGPKKWSASNALSLNVP